MPEAISLLEVFSVLPDPRIDCGKEHRLVDLLVIAVCTLLSGGESFYDMAHFARLREDWLRTFLELPGGPPSHDPFNRLFQTRSWPRSQPSKRAADPRDASLLAERGPGVVYRPRPVGGAAKRGRGGGDPRHRHQECVSLGVYPVCSLVWQPHRSR